MSYLFDDYENLVNTLSGPDGNPLGVGMSRQPQQQQQQRSQQPPNSQQQQQTPQQQQSMNINIASNTSNSNNNNNNSSLLSSSRFGSFSSNLGSEANPTDFNEALSSSLNSGILSPYSTGSSPDDFFLSATTSNADSQASGDEFEFPMDAHGQSHPFGNSGSHNDVLYPQNLVPVPMGESMSNSTVTFNTGEQNMQQQQQQQQQQFNFQPMKTVDEEDESPESRKSDYSDARATANSNGSGSTTLGPGGRRVKSSHNLIEKKYRTNINSKIIELRNCVPALRILVAKNGNHRTNSTPNEPEVEDDYYEGNGYTDDEEKCDGLKPAKKLNKATILAKASEYIKHLEKKNDTLRNENEQLRSLLNQRVSNSQGQQFGQNYSQSMHSSPYNNSSSTNGNLVSPLNAEQQGQQNQQFPYDHQTLNNKLMMGPASGFLNVNGIDEFTNSYSPSDRKFV